LWLSKDDLQDPSSWSSSPLLLLRHIHSKFLVEYNCKEGCATSQSQVHAGVNDGFSSQDGVSQKQEDTSVTIPQVNRLTESSLVWGEDSSNVTDILSLPSRHRIGSPILLRTPLYRLSLTSGLASNPANREIASSSGASEHQDIFFFDFFSIFF
jgi:hypothetical protein